MTGPQDKRTDTAVLADDGAYITVRTIPLPSFRIYGQHRGSAVKVQLHPAPMSGWQCSERSQPPLRYRRRNGVMVTFTGGLEGGSRRMAIQTV